MNYFKCEYNVDDGYAGKKARPQSFKMIEDEIEENMTEQDLVNLFEEEMEVDFKYKITPYNQNCDDFVKWANKIIKERLNEKK